ncbi:complex I subunit 4 family protein [Streptomyces iconiensis]|uniref:NADH-quinone oxidoreductase subunit M n=1 Tax=Streptomyces iconiensis TaxID=1384038 RepID=A0ABT7AAX5_9ACTN|nr:NADH-quinone oxidoreductase subunit M [Streptomyces iconiensis]MDJ1138498.1 NADH-quinone oxidoreductase subunit M [Streptomyces iconiensis]
MLTLLVLLPAAVAALLLCVPRSAPRALFLCAWTATAAAELGLVLAAWAADGTPMDDGMRYEISTRWIPSAGVGYHVGVDGLSLPLVALTCVLFLACAVYTWHEGGRGTERMREYAALFLFLQATCVGLFVALDLILFFVFFDLSLVGMYFLIAGWGHSGARRAALKFFLYTFTGSLALLLGFVGLYLASMPHTFDISELTAQNPLSGRPLYGGLVLLALGFGLAVKTPVFPFHTWLPPAHTEAPAAGSAILAGVMLKMGTYGFLRIAMPVMPGAWRDFALVFVVVGVVSVLYGALVAMAQTDFKRMIAYTSVNHMGYILLALGAVAAVTTDQHTEEARHLAVSGAVFQMVSHGLLTGGLFLLAGVLYARGRTYDMGLYSGLAARTPVLAGLTGIAAFASLGLPGFSGFVAEFQIFAGSLGARPVATALALLGILLTAALFLRALHRVFLGPLRLPRVPGGEEGPVLPGHERRFGDIRAAESVAVVPLLGLAVVLGIAPRFVLDVVEPASHAVLHLLAR